MSSMSNNSDRVTRDSEEDAFERAWQLHFTASDPVPKLEQFLPPKESGEFRKILCHLIQIDMERRWCASKFQQEARGGQDPSNPGPQHGATSNFIPPRTLQEYLAIHGLSSSDSGIMELIVAEYESRRRAGQKVDPAEYFRDYSQWRQELQDQFAEVDANIRQMQVAAATVSPLAEKPGMMIGPYKLLQMIGEGGFGVVWMAEQKAPVERMVALKIIKPGMDSGEVLARFDAERQALALMDHPHIAKVFEAGATPAGRPYFAMELVKGTTITKYCDEQRLSPRKRLELFLPVCQAIQHAHQKGIIHRDIKPSNVLVAPIDGRPDVKIIDFGIAKATGQKLTEKTLFTQFGSVVGTLEYMSPEQAELNNQDIDTRSDIYSLGVLLYELLTGTTPLLRSRLKQAAFTEMLRIIREEDPPRPSLRLSESKNLLPSISSQRKMEPAKLTDLVRGELDWIVMKALEKDRARRYETANGLAMDVQRYLADEPVAACPPSLRYQLQKFARKHRAIINSALALAVVLLIGIALSTWQAIRASNAQRVASEERDTARTAEGKATTARNEAIKSSNEANAARESELRQLYTADLLLASRAVLEGPLERAIELLDSWLPQRRGGKDYRGREWHMLRRMCDTAEMTLRGHRGPVRALAWSKDGKRLASGGADRFIRIWNADTGECLRTLAGHAAGVFDVAFSPDGTRLASASADATVRVWEVESGKERHVLRGHILPVYAVAFHPDGVELATGGGDAVIKIWDTDQGSELYALQKHDAPIGRLQFDAEGKQLASSGIIRGTLIWDLEKRAVSDLLKVSGEIVFTPDFATGMIPSAAGDIRFIDVKTKEVDVGDLGVDQIQAYDLESTARVAAICAADGSIRVVDRETSSMLIAHHGHIGAAHRALLRYDARRMATAGDDGTVRIWRVPDPTVPVPFSGHHEHIVTAAAFSKDGELLASGDYLGSIAVWNSLTGIRQQILGSHFLRRKSQPLALEIGTGKPLEDGKFKLKSQTGYTFSANTRDPIEDCFTIVGHGGLVSGVAWTPDKSLLVSTGGQDLILWDVKSGRPLKEFEHPTLVSSLAVSPDAQFAATGCWDDVVRIFRLPSGELVKELEGHKNDVMCLAFHPSGRELASGSRDQTVIVWDVAKGTVKQQLRKHLNTVSTVGYSPDGKHLVTGGLDQAIYVWNAATGEYDSSLQGHHDGITSVAFSADGKWLVTACDEESDTTVRVWLWTAGRFRDGAMIKSANSKGPSALVIHPVTGDIFMGRAQLAAVPTRPFVEKPPKVAEPVTPEVLAAKTIAESRLKILGYALTDEIVAWPFRDGERLKPTEPSGKFLVVAASLPFGRLKVSAEDFRTFEERRKMDDDNSLPIKSSSMQIYPQRFVLADAQGKPLPAQYVGRMSSAEQHGFQFMAKGVSMLEKMTATPRLDDREVVYLGWEVPKDFAPLGLQLRYENDEPVLVPSLELIAFRPGKPFHPALRTFETGEGGVRMRSNISRSPGL